MMTTNWEAFGLTVRSHILAVKSEHKGKANLDKERVLKCSEVLEEKPCMYLKTF